MNENDINAGQDAAIARLERACMAGGWIAAQIERDDVAEALRYIGDLRSGLAECQGIARDAIDALSRAEGEIDRLTEQLNHYRMAAEAEAALADRRKAELDTLREAAIRARRSLALAAEENPRFVRAYNDLDAVLSPEAQG